MGKILGIFAAEISSRIQGSLYKALQKNTKHLGYNLVFFSANRSRLNVVDTDKSALDLYKMAENMELAAILIHVMSIRNKEYIDYVIDMGKRKGIPVFLYDCDAYGYTKEDGVITINLDYKQGFAESVRHLLECHHCTNVYMLAGVRDNQFSNDRIDAYKREMAAHNLPVSDDHILYGDFWELPAKEAVKNLMESDLEKPDAICCANDYMAIAAAEVVKAKGYKVPEDIRITGFDGIEDGRYNFPVISTCTPVLDAVPEFIFDAIEKKLRVGEFLVPLCFYPKESCGCENSDSINDRKEMARMMENNRMNANQHSMLSNMQIQLMDSCNLQDITGYMNGIIGAFKGYKHLYCLRDDIDTYDNHSNDCDKMRVQLNLGLLPKDQYEAFPVKNIIPDYDQVITNAAPGELFVFSMLQSIDKKYGYTLINADYYSTTQIKIFQQYSESFTNMTEIILRNRRLAQANQKLNEMFERMSEIYIRDMMTDLYNRTGYYSELDSYLTREDFKGKYVHIVAVDMDGMKAINDEYGHQEGDIAIKSVAAAIRDCLSRPCIAARFGGDEFMVALFSDREDEPDQEQLSEQLNHYLASDAVLCTKPYKVGVSVGHAVCRVSKVYDISKLEKLADDSMYADKKRRKEQTLG